MCGQTWPEQNAVDEWLKKYNISVDHKVAMELKNTVTKFRIKSDDRVRELEKLLNCGSEKPSPNKQSESLLCPKCSRADICGVHKVGKHIIAVKCNDFQL